jgi:hypothetical protein
METSSSTEEQILEFEARWYRLGGGPSDEIYSRFGMTDRDFFGRVDHLISTGRALDEIAPRDVEVMKAVIRRRLWLAG